MNVYRRVYEKIKRLYLSCFSLEKQAKLVGVNIGKNNFIDSRFWSSEPYLIKIGSNCQITKGVYIYTHGGGNVVRHINPKFDCFGKVEIGNYVYIGNNSLIMPGVTIGNNVLIAAGSVVTKSIPDNLVIAGNPAKVICSIDDYYKRNEKFNCNTKGMSHYKKRKILTKMSSNQFITKSYITR